MSRIALLVVLLMFAGPAVAEDRNVPPPPADDGNFAMMPATGQHLRIDRRNGAVSLCSERDGKWACELLADDRAAYENRIDELERQLDALRAENAELRAKLSAATPLPADPSATSEREFDRFLGFADRMFRHFFDLVDEYKAGRDKPI